MYLKILNCEKEHWNFDYDGDLLEWVKHRVLYLDYTNIIITERQIILIARNFLKYIYIFL